MISYCWGEKVMKGKKNKMTGDPPHPKASSPPTPTVIIESRCQIQKEKVVSRYKQTLTAGGTNNCPTNKLLNISDSFQVFLTAFSFGIPIEITSIYTFP